MCNLIEEIEQCRKELMHLSQKHELTSNIIVQHSKKLDTLLNKYQKHSAG